MLRQAECAQDARIPMPTHRPSSKMSATTIQPLCIHKTWLSGECCPKGVLLHVMRGADSCYFLLSLTCLPLQRVGTQLQQCVGVERAQEDPGGAHQQRLKCNSEPEWQTDRQRQCRQDGAVSYWLSCSEALGMQVMHHTRAPLAQRVGPQLGRARENPEGAHGNGEHACLPFKLRDSFKFDIV